MATRAARIPRKPGLVHTPRRQVPSHVVKPSYAKNGTHVSVHGPPLIHDASSLIKMRQACLVASDMLDYAGQLVEPGITTEEIDRQVHEAFGTKWNAYPAPLNFMGFPKSICTSVNDVVCHGIPDNQTLESGDIISIDISSYVDGFYGDNCRTFIVGEKTDVDSIRLVYATKKALLDAIDVVGPGVRINKIGEAIDQIMTKYGLDSVRQYCGHGIATQFHSLPLIKHFKNDDDFILQENMTFTIEPMLVEGSAAIREWKDRWTVVTADHQRCAQFEHTLLITPHGAEVLTPYSTEKEELQAWESQIEQNKEETTRV